MAAPPASAIRGRCPSRSRAAINKNDLVAASVLSGNRNFEGRVSPDVRANYLASPPLVVAYAVKGTVVEDMVADADRHRTQTGSDVYLKDIWPSNDEIRSLIDQYVNGDMFRARYADVYKGDVRWQGIDVIGGATYGWPAGSTYIANPPYFEGMTMTPTPPGDIVDARPLAILGDSHHHRPHLARRRDQARQPGRKIPLGASGQPRRLQLLRRPPRQSRSHDARHLRQHPHQEPMVPGIEGGITRHIPTGAQMPIYDAAMLYKEEGTPLVIIAGKEYGTGSSRDWAAKGTNLLGVRAVIAETYERIHRSNLVGMGVIPLQFVDEVPQFDGTETFTILGVGELTPRKEIAVKVTTADGTSFTFAARVRIDTANELEYFRNGGILHYVLRNLARGAAA